jgi:hypothetical protein
MKVAGAVDSGPAVNPVAEGVWVMSSLQGSDSLLNARKPWPTDAAMIVASVPDEATYIDGQNPRCGRCRGCDAKVLYSDFTVAQARSAMPCKPVMFFCIECAIQHDLPPVLVDLRPLGPISSPPRATV